MRRVALLALVSLLAAGAAWGQPKTRIQGEYVCATAPSPGEALVYNGTAWCPGAGGTFAGGTLTSELVCAIDGIEFQETDTITDCSSFAATGGGIFFDDSEGVFKKCEDGALTVLDTTGGTPAFSGISSATNTTAAMVVGTGASLAVSGSGTIAATTSAALAANGANCAAGSYPLGVDASGAAETCTDASTEIDSILAAGNAATATALAANGANCSAGSAPLGVDASGAAETCTDYEEDLANSAGLLAALDDETGTGLAVFNASPLISAANLRGVYDLTGTAVDDDDCTGQQGSGWWDSTDSAWEFCNANSGAPATLGGGGLANIVEDVTPQLGAMLDVNAFSLGDGTLELLSFVETASAVNEITVTNAATGGDPELTASGDDAAIGFKILAKSSDPVCLGGNGEKSILCVTNDGTDSSVTITGDSTQGANTNIFQVKNSAGTVLWGVQGDGDLLAPSGSRKMGVGSQYWLMNDSANTATLYTGASSRLVYGSAAGAGYFTFSGGIANSDVAVVDTTITGSDANAAASTNQDGADIVLDPGDNATGGGTDGRVLIKKSSYHECQSAPPAGGVKGQLYCDSDLTVPCWHNGTNWVQMDDFSTTCS